MIYLIFFASAVATAGLFALAARVMIGIEHAGLLAAIGVIGGGLQMFGLIAWYLWQTRGVAAHQASQENLGR